MSAIAIFVKTPGYSPIKTRLARSIGRAQAEACHRRSASCVFETVRQSELIGYWAVAEVEAMEDPLWQSLPRVHQGSGSLGARMHRVHAELVQQHGSAILVGADLPQLSVDDLHSASTWLDSDSPRSVLGSARDGGFWLYGANHVHAESIWTSIPYSQADTAEQFVQAMQGGDWQWLAKKRDIDQVGDISQVVTELQQLPEPTTAQRNLAAWLSESGYE